MSKSSSLPRVVLKAGREKSVLNRHPWIFSGAVGVDPACEDGALVQVCSAAGEVLGAGYWNSVSSLRVRLLSYGEAHPLDALRENLERALLFRELLGLKGTSALRLVNAEGDFIPGLVVDRYADVLVLQVGTLGMEKLKSEIVEWLVERIRPRAVYEKSNVSSRREEGLERHEALLWGEDPGRVKVQEYGHSFLVDIAKGQKTGFFLDQREMRALVGAYASGRRVLNCFSFSGGFSVYAARGGASYVESVDVSSDAIELAREHFALNDVPVAAHGFVVRDVFEHLRGGADQFEMVILDPPAFAKKKDHVRQACRGYGEINREGLNRVAPGGFMVTCSCSYFVDEKLFQQVVFQAARDARRLVRIVQRHRQAMDHPVSIFHPEGSYLKSLVLEVGPRLP